MSDIIVLIPGITGSVLQRDGKDVWAITTGAAFRAALSLGKSIKRLQLAGDDPDVDDLGDGIVATRLMPDLHVLPGVDWKIDGYGRIRDRLLAAFECVPNQNYFEFPYDWRRDNRVAARLLARKSHDWLNAWRQMSNNADAKLILIGHSMGGIVARLFLEFLDGWKSTRTLVTYGTPYSGAVNAADFLFNGFRRGWGLLSVDLSTLLRSFTSMYQLLPSYRVLAGVDGTLEYLDSVHWEVPAVDNTRLRQAIELQRTLRKAVDDRRATGKPGYEIRPIVGDFQPTLCGLRRRGDGVEALYERAPGEGGGDGTVPKVSASPHEFAAAQANTMFSSQLHASLQNDEAVLVHTVGAIRPGPAVPVFPAADISVALQASDVSTLEAMRVRARPSDLTVRVQVLIEPIGGRAAHDVRKVTLADAPDGWQEASIDGLAPGDYRVQVVTPELHRAVAVASVVDLAALEAQADTED